MVILDGTERAEKSKRCLSGTFVSLFSHIGDEVWAYWLFNCQKLFEWQANIVGNLAEQRR